MPTKGSALFSQMSHGRGKDITVTVIRMTGKSTETQVPEGQVDGGL